MSDEPKPQSYYAGLNQSLFAAVPIDARRILEVGCAEGNLGAALKQQVPERTLFGVESQPDVAARATQKLDQVFVIDVSAEDPPLEPASLDCIIFGDVLEHLVDPEEALRRLRKFLAPGGQIVCSIPNIQHHSMLAALLTGDFQYTTAGLLDATHLRFFTASTIQKLLLDAGYAPTFVERIRVPAPAELLAAAEPLLKYFGLHPARTAGYLGAYQYIVRGTPIEASDGAWGRGVASDTVPLSIVACVSDDSIVQANLLASPDLRAGSPHEVLLVRGCSNAADGLNLGIERARHDVVVLAHQDVYLPRGWTARLTRKYREAEKQFGPLGIAGVYGVAMTDTGPRRVGHVVDRDTLRNEGTPLPVSVATLDELLMVVPRRTPIRFDPSLGFHFYGADYCLAARDKGLAAVVIDALCLHNSRNVEVAATFLAIASRFAGKWAARLPIATPCALIDRQGMIQRF